MPTASDESLPSLGLTLSAPSRHFADAEYLYTDRGNPFENREHAESILAGIRHQLTKKPRDLVLARYLPLASAKFSVRSWLPRWLAHFEAQVTAGQRSPGTLREYRRYAAEGGAFDALRDFSLYEITFERLDDWRGGMLKARHYRTGEPVRPKLVRNTLAAFGAFLRWCRRRVPDLVLPEFPAIAVPEYRYTKVSPKTRGAILAAVPEPRRGAFLAASLGIRPGEIRALNVGDYNLESWELTIAGAMKTPSAKAAPGPTKGLRCRTLPVTNELREWIGRYRDGAPEDAPLFQNPTGLSRDRRWHGNALREEWLRACAEVGVTVKMYEGTKHSFATELVERGVELGLVQRFLGHADRRSGDHYTNRATGALVAVLRPRREP